MQVTTCESCESDHSSIGERRSSPGNRLSKCDGNLPLFLGELDVVLGEVRDRLTYAFEYAANGAKNFSEQSGQAAVVEDPPPDLMIVASERISAHSDDELGGSKVPTEGSLHALELASNAGVSLSTSQAQRLSSLGSVLSPSSCHTLSSRTPNKKTTMTRVATRSRQGTVGRGFVALPAWKPKDVDLEGRGLQFSGVSDSITEATNREVGVSLASTEGLIREPNGLQFLAWLSIGLVLITWDLIWTPLVFLDIDETVGTFVIGWIARIYWTIDIPLSFMTGFLRPDGMLELRKEMIWKRYALTWLGFDLTIVTADWVESLVTQTRDLGFLNAARVGKASRMVRMIRILRVARVLKAPVLFAPIADRVFSDFVMFLCRVGAVTLGLMSFTHLVACIFFDIGGDKDDGWITVNGMENKTVEFKYVAALQWSISQLVGNSDIVTHNFTERSFAVGAIVIYFLLSIYFVSSITTAMTRMQMMQSKEEAQFAILRRYLKTGSVSKHLITRIVQNAQYAIKIKQTNVVAEDVELLAVLSEPLRMELHYDLHCTVLLSHPLLEAYIMKRTGGMHKILYSCARPAQILKGDIIFTRGHRQKHPSMVFVGSGSLTYTRDDEEPVEINVGMWIGEMVLWTDWVHMGTLYASEDCKVLQIDSAKFAKAVELIFQSGDSDHPKFYAAKYIGALNSLDLARLSDLDYGLSQMWKPPYCSNQRRLSRQTPAAVRAGMRALAFGGRL